MAGLTPTLLLILDGWGIAPPGPGNAVSLANTPNIDALLATYPRTRLACCGRAVGLPDGFMGNSEVGHMNIGAGRVVYQDMTRIDIAIEEGKLDENETLAALLAAAKAKGGRIHYMGLLSDGGVHSHIRHLFGLLLLAKKAGVEPVVHVFTDGRDTPPDSGKGFVADLERFMAENGVGRIATVTGRYYAMDRDKRWDRTGMAYDALTLGKGEAVADAASAVEAAYAAGETDEFIKPRIVQRDGRPVATLDDGDAVFFFNFRADRARQMTRALFDDGFDGFARAKRPALAGLATMTQYENAFGLPVAFAPVHITRTLGEFLSARGNAQLRIAETEKYAHVTYFFNAGVEDPYPGEERRLIPSPRDVATYDLKPQMSADKVCDTLLEEWNKGVYDLVVCNFANPDMVGHTGIIPAVITALETVDACVGRIRDAVLASGGRILMTADHGNSERMLDEEGHPFTAHSMNPVHFVYIERGAENGKGVAMREGVLGDIAPTILGLWGVTPPAEMTGGSLIHKGDA
ncbi:MAG: 2,3-bisphosphoglycerate-independent phosphoglycerate mutase [Desulfovibrionaceae bacterium]